ncbi:hypothetical protein Taro_026092 [Colocasia esculenta]|uniref:Dienelactone hydrolase domain-containing protein n=1 Tax=Colocasia esculenta TaxID=4460 RepID=A0A843VIH3_COLES|nr:hypothetical protein [Colocasia esculenta]
MLSRHCCSNPPKLDPHCGLGTVLRDLAGLPAYTAGSPTCSRAVLLVTDIYGYDAPNLRNIADKVAAAGFFVVAPDFFYGDPYEDGESWDDWLSRHGTAKGAADAIAVVAALKRGGATSIGAAGFCWGGKVVVELAKTNDIDAAVLLHPSMVTVDDIKEVNVPIEILGGDLDELTPPSVLKQFEAALSAKSGVDSFVKIFPGVPHGFSIRYDANDKVAVKKAEEAQHDMLSWFLKYVRQERNFSTLSSTLRKMIPQNNRWSPPSRGQLVSTSKKAPAAAVKPGKGWTKDECGGGWMDDAHVITVEEHLRQMETRIGAKMNRLEVRLFSLICAALCIGLVFAFLQ